MVPSLLPINPEPRIPTAYHVLVSIKFERSHINGEAVLDIRLEQSFLGLVYLLDRDDFNLRGNVARPAKVKHLLSLRYPAHV